MFALLNLLSDEEALKRALKLALRDPGLIGAGLRSLFEGQGFNIVEMMSGEPDAPPTKAEVLTLVEPALKTGVEMATFAQMVDIYLFGQELTPENQVYAFYIGARYAIAREREPTNVEVKQIWHIALTLARNSKIGTPHWSELEGKGKFELKDWLDPLKESARKRFETFLEQKRRAEAAAEQSLNHIMSQVFSDDEEAQ
ncbi:MAG: hypothetical protein DMF64_00160 [Acidobacteria bacterium]|nr:MAG: hypothetical protein DMF64_00160 [Acidobacteriota bacterium]